MPAVHKSYLITSDFQVGFTMKFETEKSKVPDWRKITAGKIILKKKSKKAFQAVTQFGNLRKVEVCVQEETALGTQRNGNSCLQPIFVALSSAIHTSELEKAFLSTASNKAHASRGLWSHYAWAHATASSSESLWEERY